MDSIKNFFKREPLVVVNTLAVLVGGVYQEVVADLEPGDGWKVIGVAIATAIVRRLVTPVPKPLQGQAGPTAGTKVVFHPRRDTKVIWTNLEEEVHYDPWLEGP